MSGKRITSLRQNLVRSRFTIEKWNTKPKTQEKIFSNLLIFISLFLYFTKQICWLFKRFSKIIWSERIKKRLLIPLIAQYALHWLHSLNLLHTNCINKQKSKKKNKNENNNFHSVQSSFFQHILPQASKELPQLSQ